MLAPGPVVALASEEPQVFAQPPAHLARRNHLVDEAELRGLEGARELGAIFGDQLLAVPPASCAVVDCGEDSPFDMCDDSE